MLGSMSGEGGLCETLLCCCCGGSAIAGEWLCVELSLPSLLLLRLLADRCALPANDANPLISSYSNTVLSDST